MISLILFQVRHNAKAVTAAMVRYSSVSDAAKSVAAFVQADIASLARYNRSACSALCCSCSEFVCPLLDAHRCELLNVDAIKAVNQFFNKTYDETPTLFLEFHGLTG